MAFPTKQALNELLAVTNQPAVSIYLPTHQVVDRWAPQDPIRFRNLLSRGKRELMAAGLRRPEAADLLVPAHALLQDPTFWERRSVGLAVFVTEGLFRCVRLPIAPPEIVVVARRLHLKPLFRFLTGDGRYWLLAVAANSVRLFQGDRESLRAVDASHLPHSLAEALAPDDVENQVQFHTGGSPDAAGHRASIYHGQGTGVDDRKDRLLQFFRRVDAGLHEVLRDDDAPLVLAGVEELFPIYAKANTYRRLAERGVPGNADLADVRDLHARSWALIEPHFQSALRDARDRFDALFGSGSDLATTEPAPVITAARDGRIDTLFVAVGRQLWGSIDSEGVPNILSGGPERGSEDLLNLAAVETLHHRGRVFALSSDEMPKGAMVAAVFRYPVPPSQQAAD